jgi:hypothetical protein
LTQEISSTRKALRPIECAHHPDRRQRQCHRARQPWLTQSTQARSTAAEPSGLFLDFFSFLFPYSAGSIPPLCFPSLAVYGLGRRVTLWFSNGQQVCSGSTFQLILYTLRRKQFENPIFSCVVDFWSPFFFASFVGSRLYNYAGLDTGYYYLLLAH